MIRLAILFALSCIVNVTTAYFQLNGNLAESTGMPVTLHCPVTLGYIVVGGITVNNKPMDSKRQDNCVKACDRQMKKYEEARLDPSKTPNGDGTMCVLSMPRKDVGDDDIVRVVFSCHDQKPSGAEVWGEEVGKKKEPEPKSTLTSSNNDAILTCQKRKEVITIEGLKLNEAVPNVATHPDLDPQTMTDKCYQEWTTQLQGPGKNYNPMCTISNTYGGDLEITYVCLGPGQKGKEKGDKKGKKEKKEKKDKEDKDKDKGKPKKNQGF